MPSWFPLAISIVLALVPVAVWLRIINKIPEERGILIKTFLLGTFSVIPPFILIFLFEKFPGLNVYSLISDNIEELALAFLLTNLLVGIIEEIGKHLIVRIVDKRHPEYLQTLSSVLRLSICAGLGFSFAENIFYFYTITSNSWYGAIDLFSTFVFRSVFTMCGHMVFSGIFGYFFGIGKFAADILDQARWEGRGLWFARLFARLSGRMVFQVVREQKILLGLFLAIGMHAAFNVSLDLQLKLPAIGIVVFGALYIAYLLKRKSGHMIFSITKRRSSTMAPRDEEVVLELLGMFSKEGHMQEVVTICDRLLKRDPDNNVVKLFRAKAADNEQLRHVFRSLEEYFGKSKTASALEAVQNTGGAGVNKTGAVSGAPKLNIDDEKLILEVMDMWFREGNFKQVLAIANRLLEKNPNSDGAKTLLHKAMENEKLVKMFASLQKLFHY